MSKFTVQANYVGRGWQFCSFSLIISKEEFLQGYDVERYLFPRNQAHKLFMHLIKSKDSYEDIIALKIVEMNHWAEYKVDSNVVEYKELR